MLLLNLLPWVGMTLAASLQHEHAYRDMAAQNLDLSARAAPPAATSQTPNFTFEELYNLQVKFLDNFVYPNNTKQVCSALHLIPN